MLRTMPYPVEDMVQIIRIRAKTESLSLDEEALPVLAEIATRATLKYIIFTLIKETLD